MIAFDAVLPAGIHQGLHAKDICPQEDARIFNGTVHMRFCRKVNHHIKVFLRKQVINEIAVCNIPFDKLEVWFVHNRFQGFEISRIGQCVQNNNFIIRIFIHHQMGKVSANKSCSTSN